MQTLWFGPIFEVEHLDDFGDAHLGCSEHLAHAHDSLAGNLEMEPLDQTGLVGMVGASYSGEHLEVYPSGPGDGLGKFRQDEDRDDLHGHRAPKYLEHVQGSHLALGLHCEDFLPLYQAGAVVRR